MKNRDHASSKPSAIPRQSSATSSVRTTGSTATAPRIVFHSFTVEHSVRTIRCAPLPWPTRWCTTTLRHLPSRLGGGVTGQTVTGVHDSPSGLLGQSLDEAILLA